MAVIIMADIRLTEIDWRGPLREACRRIEKKGGEKEDRIVETREVDALKDGRVIKREHKEGMNIRHGRQKLP